jgi:ADP-L-glycero-D-manno-heptose 6-epimerase
MASPYHKFTEQAKSGTIRVFENSENYFRDFIHVDQVIDVQEKFLSIEASGLWNLGTGKVRSFMDVANDVAKHYPASIEYIPMPEEVKNSYQEYTCANTDLLEYTLKEYYERKV